jgi:hypothetical protein
MAQELPLGSDERLAHLCKLAVVAAYPFGESREDWCDYVRKADASELFNLFSALGILAEAFMLLLEKHPELKPTFRVRAATEPSNG